MFNMHEHPVLKPVSSVVPSARESRWLGGVHQKNNACSPVSSQLGAGHERGRIGGSGGPQSGAWRRPGQDAAPELVPLIGLSSWRFRGRFRLRV